LAVVFVDCLHPLLKHIAKPDRGMEVSSLKELKVMPIPKSHQDVGIHIGLDIVVYMPSGVVA
jgi:hypothetical protein